jgi:hypothetical protein
MRYHEAQEIVARRQAVDAADTFIENNPPPEAAVTTLMRPEVMKATSLGERTVGLKQTVTNAIDGGHKKIDEAEAKLKAALALQDQIVNDALGDILGLENQLRQLTNAVGDVGNDEEAKKA